jgi:hypothetical protein
MEGGIGILDTDVPVIDSDGETIIGFDGDRLEGILKTLG